MQFDSIPSGAAFDGQNRRTFYRRRLLKSATISPDGLDTVYDGVLRNVSKNGARVRVVSQIGIPNAFKLVSKEEQIDVSARVIWRSEKEIGVEFLNN